MNKAIEKWKPVDGWSLYEVSDKGRVRSKDRLVRCGKGYAIKKGRVLRLMIDDFGYPRVELKQNGASKKERVHRLVCKAFVPNPLNKPCVNHIDNNPSNNCAENLEWVTHKENTGWMVAQGRATRTKTWLANLHKAQKERQYKPVRGTNIKTSEIIECECVNHVTQYGFSAGCVSECCNGKMKTHKGYTWEFI